MLGISDTITEVSEETRSLNDQNIGFPFLAFLLLMPLHFIKIFFLLLHIPLFCFLYDKSSPLKAYRYWAMSCANDTQCSLKLALWMTRLLSF